MNLAAEQQPAPPSAQPSAADLNREYFENTMLAKNLREAGFDEYAELVFQLTHLVQGPNWHTIQNLVTQHALKLIQKK